MPFYPTADRDDGYDITDYYGIDPRLGTFGDFVEFMRTAHDRGMRVIADLVANHTSDEHPWFQSARRSRGLAASATTTSGATRSRRRTRGRACSRASRTASGRYDTEAGQYYLHRFYRHQPDLNVANAAVREEIRKIIGFWLALGLVRVPRRRRAVPARDRRARRATWARPARVPARPARLPRRGERATRSCSARSTCPPTSSASSSATRTATSCTCCSTSSPCRPPTWRSARAGRPTARRGAGRRAGRSPHEARVGDVPAQPRRADAGQADRRRARTRSSPPSGPTPTCSSTAAGSVAGCRPCSTATSGGSAWPTACCSPCPGTPTLFYGEEIGMGENLDVDDRLAVRTPMQWTAGRRPGSPPPRPTRSCRPLPTDARFGPTRQRPRPAPRPGVAAQLVRAADPAAQGAARRSAGARARCSTPTAGRSSRCATTGGTARSSPCTTSPAARRSPRSTWTMSTAPCSRVAQRRRRHHGDTTRPGPGAARRARATVAAPRSPVGAFPGRG